MSTFKLIIISLSYAIWPHDITDASALIFLGTLLAISVQLRRWKLTFRNYRLLWPMLIIDYRNYTKKHYGKAGKLYYMALISGLLLAISILSEITMHIVDFLST
jgi:hypothetical protein